MARKALLLILALYLALAAGYAAVTPFGTAPDETAHAFYVQHLVRERTLPVLRRAQRDAYEYHQPPLYYLLAAPFWAAASPGEIAPPPSSSAPPSPPPRSCIAARVVSILVGAVGIWLIAALGGALTPREGRGSEALSLAAAGFAAFLPMRLATAASVSNDTLAEAVFTAALLLMLIMVREGATPRRAVRLGIVLGLGVLTKSSDLLLFPVALVALLYASRSPVEGPNPLPPSLQGKGGRRGRVRSSADLPVGGSHLSSLAARPPGGADRKVGAAAAHRGPDGQPNGTSPTAASDAARFMRCAAVTFGLALLIGGGWMLRNARLYGDPLGTKAFEQYFQDTPTPEIWTQLLGYSRLDVLVRKTLPLTFESFWGVFGHMDRFMGTYPRGVEPPGWAHLLADHHYPPPSWVYPLLLIPCLIAVGGLVRHGVGCWVLGVGFGSPNTQHPTPNTQPLLLSLAAFLVLAAYLRFNTEFFQAQGRYLFPAMGPIALGFASGWLAWWPPRHRAGAVILLLASMLALALFALFGTLMPAFGGQ